MKKLNLLTLILLLLITTASIAQTYVIQAKPLDSKEWGYINLNGEYLIPPQFRKCYEFSESGYAPIYDKKKGYYFININGEKLPTEISNFKLKQMFGFGTQGFKEGMVPVLVNEKWGFLNEMGKLVIEPKYDKVSRFEEGYSIAKIGEQFFIVDKVGNEILIQAPGVVDVRVFSEGMAPYKTKDGYYGFIGIDGNIRIEAQYLSVGYFKLGVAWAKTKYETIGYLNISGEWVIQPQFFTVNDFDPETKLAKIKQGEKWVYLTFNGDIIEFNESDVISEFYEGLAKGKKFNKFGFYNSNMEWVIAPKFDGVRNFKNGYAAAKQGDKWGIIDKQGNWIIEPIYSALKDVEKII